MAGVVDISSEMEVRLGKEGVWLLLDPVSGLLMLEYSVHLRASETG